MRRGGTARMGLVVGILGLLAGPASSQERDHPFARDPRFQNACQFWTEEQTDAALQLFEELCAEQPGDGFRPALITDFLVKQQAYEPALSFARQARRKLPEAARSFGLLGMCLFQLGRYAEAEEVFRAAVRRHPRDPGMWFNLAMVLGTLHQMLESMECLDRALELDPGNPQYHYNRGENWLARVRYAEAEREFRIAAGARVAHPDAFWRLGQVLAFLERDEEAEQWFGRAMSLPDRPDLRGALLRGAYQFGVFLFERSRPEEAAKLLERFVAGAPEDRMGWMYLARCQKALGRHDQARVSVERYRSLQAREDQADRERRLREFRRHFEAAGAGTKSRKGSTGGSSDDDPEDSAGDSG